MRHLSIFALLLTLASATQGQTPAPSARALLERSSAMVAPSPDSATTHSFQVSLLVADVQGQQGFEGLSKSAMKALEDLRDFLPFKSYKLLDFAWLRTAGRSSARVKGPDGQTYELSLRLANTLDEDEGKIFISSFTLRDSDNSTARRDREQAERFPSGFFRERSLISTSFAMDEGETVVVGTSRLDDGQKALVVLLTAVPSSVAGG